MVDMKTPKRLVFGDVYFMFVNRLNTPTTPFCYPVSYCTKKLITCIAYNCFYIIFINYFSSLRLQVAKQCCFFSGFVNVLINKIFIFIPCILFNSPIKNPWLILLIYAVVLTDLKSKKISNDQELILSDPISCPQNQKGNN